MNMYNHNYRCIITGLIAGVLIFTSCSSTDSNNDGPPFSVQGTWKSKPVTPQDDELIMTLELKQEGAQISGTLVVDFTNYPDEDPNRFAIKSGTYNPPDLSITTETDADNKSEESLACSIENEKTMLCKVSSSGNSTTTITLTKQ